MNGFRRVCLLGFDRITGSFALGLKRTGFRGTIVGVGDDAILATCWKLGMISDGTADLAKGVAGADLVMVSSPTRNAGSTLTAVLDVVDEGAVVSETTRVKGDMQKVFDRSGRDDVHYIGFRVLGDVPGEGRVTESNKFFFEGRTVILTPRGKQDLEAYAQLHDVMQKMGARVIAMSPQAHDRLLARVTQVPKTAVLAVLQSIFLGDDADALLSTEILAKFLRDEMHELAQMESAGWVEDIHANRELVLQGLNDVLARLQQIKADIQAGELPAKLRELLTRTQGLVGESRNGKRAGLIVVTGSDKKTIERVAKVLASNRIKVGRLDRMEHSEPGTYRMTLESESERERAVQLLKHLGLEVTETV